MPLASIVSIASARLTLVPLAAEHLDDLMAVNGDERVTRFVPYATWATRADAEAWHARMRTVCDGGSAHQLVLQRRLDGRAIGTLLLFKHDEASRRIELGYALGHDHWGQGLMREAVEAACAHAFDALDIRRIEAEVNPANAASCALLERVGFTLEGRARQRWTGKGATYDTHLYGLLADEWPRGVGASGSERGAGRNDGPEPTAADVVREFWRLMASNDFASVQAVLAPEFVLEWPQSKERIRGPERFVRMNVEYPAHGAWRFTVHHVVGGDGEAVSDVSITDGVQAARALSFFSVRAGRIVRLVEYWPEPYAAPAHRAHLVEAMDEPTASPTPPPTAPPTAAPMP